jgi:hypothetical protein
MQPPIIGGFLLPLCGSNSPCERFCVVGVYSCTPQPLNGLQAVFGALWRMGQNTHILPIFTMVKYGFYFWLKNGCDFGVFFSTSHRAGTGFPQKS